MIERTRVRVKTLLSAPELGLHLALQLGRMLLRGGRPAARRPGDHLALAGAPSGGEVGGELRVRRLRRRDTLPARGLEAALPAAAAHGLPVLAATVAGRLLPMAGPLDVG